MHRGPMHSTPGLVVDDDAATHGTAAEVAQRDTEAPGAHERRVCVGVHRRPKAAVVSSPRHAACGCVCTGQTVMVGAHLCLAGCGGPSG